MEKKRTLRLGAKSRQALPPLSAADLARSAATRREATNQIGRMLREMQIEAFQRMLEVYEGDGSGAEDKI